MTPRAMLLPLLFLGTAIAQDSAPIRLSGRGSRTLSADFDKSAIDAVKKWKFTPATRDNKPIAVEIDVQVAFRLY
jgi:TonB family protein